VWSALGNVALAVDPFAAGHEALRERGLHMAAAARRGGDTVPGTIATFVHRHWTHINTRTAARYRNNSLFEKLRAMLDALKRAQNGARSEKRDADEAQLALRLGDPSAVPVEPERDAAAGGEPDPPKPARSKASRNIGGLPNHLPREEIVIEVERFARDHDPQARPGRQAEDHACRPMWIMTRRSVVPSTGPEKRIRMPRFRSPAFPTGSTRRSPQQRFAVYWFGPYDCPPPRLGPRREAERKTASHRSPCAAMSATTHD
jgi:hypothetical protein